MGKAHDRRKFMDLRRMWFALAAAATLLCLSGPAALSQAKYPNRPVRIIVPLPPGGAIDVFVRGLGKEFETRTGAGVVVENRAGANTILAANACKTASPDGYTFCLLTRSTVSINPEIYRKLSYEPLKDFEPATNGFFGQQIVILNKNVPVKTLAELVDYSRKNPDKLNFASMGLGGDSHLIMEWLKHETGAKIHLCAVQRLPRGDDVVQGQRCSDDRASCRQSRSGAADSRRRSQRTVAAGLDAIQSRAGSPNICRIRFNRR